MKSYARGKIILFALFIAGALPSIQAATCDKEGFICEGDKVLFDGKRGTVKRVIEDPDGTENALIDFRWYIFHSYEPVSSLAKSLGCSESEYICEGDWVTYGHKIGTVLGVFSNDEALIDVEGVIRHSYESVFNLIKSVECLNGICEGNWVQYRPRDFLGFREMGRVLAIFPNGNILVDGGGISSNIQGHVTVIVH